jgi:hypothetical protein
MIPGKIWSAFMVMFLGPGAAYGQSTLGEVLDKGGRKLNRGELTTLLPGASSSGLNGDGHHLHVSYKADGTMSGSMTFNSGQFFGRTVGLFGNWNLEEDGKVCAQVRSTSGPQSTLCSYMFRLGDEVYVIPSEVDRSARATLRNLRK